MPLSGGMGVSPRKGGALVVWGRNTVKKSTGEG